MKSTTMAPSPLLRPFAVPPRAAIEFAVVFSALSMADPTRTSVIMGSVVAAVGIAIRIWTAGFGYNLDELTVKGPYRFVRHPYLLGSGLLFLGICLSSRHVFVTGFAVFALIAVYRTDVRRDEARLARSLGPKFQNFRDRVPAFIPALIPELGLSADGHRFSMGLALFRGRHRELNTLLWVSAVFVLMFVCSQISDKSLFHVTVLVAGVLIASGRLWVAKFRRQPIK